MFTSLEFNKIFSCEWKRMDVMLMCPHEFHVALCDVTVKNVALSLSLAGHPCCRLYSYIQSIYNQNVKSFKQRHQQRQQYDFINDFPSEKRGF